MKFSRPFNTGVTSAYVIVPGSSINLVAYYATANGSPPSVVSQNVQQTISFVTTATASATSTVTPCTNFFCQKGTLAVMGLASVVVSITAQNVLSLYLQTALAGLIDWVGSATSTWLD